MTNRPGGRRALTPVAGMLAAAIGVSACGSDGGVAGPEAGQLSQVEAADLMAALMTVYTPTFSLPVGGSSAAATPAVVAAPDTTVSVNGPRTFVRSCPAGGDLTLQSVDSLTIIVDIDPIGAGGTTYGSDTSYDGSSSIVATYNGCGTIGGLGGVWTIDANPGLSFVLDIEGAIVTRGDLTAGTIELDSSTSYDGLWSGALNWTNGSRSGTCTVMLSLVSSTTMRNDTTRTTLVNRGQMCGLPVGDSVQVVTAVG